MSEKENRAMVEQALYEFQDKLLREGLNCLLEDKGLLLTDIDYGGLDCFSPTMKVNLTFRHTKK